MIKHLRFLPVLLIIFLLGACDSSDPSKVKQRQHLPGADFVANVDKGSSLFRTNCAKCHGGAGKGTARGPALIHKIYRPAHHADLAFHWAVKSGVKQHHWHFGDMPPIAITPQEVGHIISYVRQEQRNNGIR